MYMRNNARLFSGVRPKLPGAHRRNSDGDAAREPPAARPLLHAATRQLPQPESIRAQRKAARPLLQVGLLQFYTVHVHVEPKE